MSIFKHILDFAIPGSDVSKETELKEYFDCFSTAQDLCPIADVDPEYRDEYTRARVHPDRFGFSKVLDVDVNFRSENAMYMLVEKIIYTGDSIEMEIASILKKGGLVKQGLLKGGFVYNLLKKHRDFLAKIVEKDKLDPQDAVIKVHAHSGIVDNIKTRGGYVWATYGFDFASSDELSRARTAFKRFAKNSNVDISDRDLKYFKHPCHFAAFSVSGAESPVELGKEFLLQYEWFGVMTANPDQNSELFRYQQAYHEKGKKEALGELSKAYLCVLNKYQHRRESRRETLQKFVKTTKEFIAEKTRRFL